MYGSVTLFILATLHAGYAHIGVVLLVQTLHIFSIDTYRVGVHPPTLIYTF